MAWTRLGRKDAFSYREGGPTPLKLAMLGLSIAVLVLAILWRAPLFLFVPIGIALVLSAVLVARNPVRGIDIDGRSLSIVRPDGTRRIPLAAIRQVTVDHWTDATDVTLLLDDGEEIVLPADARPSVPVLMHELSRRGLFVAET